MTDEVDRAKAEQFRDNLLATVVGGPYVIYAAKLDGELDVMLLGYQQTERDVVPVALAIDDALFERIEVENTAGGDARHRAGDPE